MIKLKYPEKNLYVKLESFNKEELNSFKEELKSIKKELRARNSDKKFGVAQNTFRALGNYAPKEKPSTTYRNWAQSTYQDILKNQPNIQTEADFNKWHKELADKLNNFWINQQEIKLPFAYRYKLVDLFIKWICRVNTTPINIVDTFIKFAYCPLDTQSLSSIDLCYCCELKKFEEQNNISKNDAIFREPRMGKIKSREYYDFCQKLISCFAHAAGATPLLFDFYAWKRGGGSEQSPCESIKSICPEKVPINCY